MCSRAAGLYQELPVSYIVIYICMSLSHFFKCINNHARNYKCTEIPGIDIPHLMSYLGGSVGGALIMYSYPSSKSVHSFQQCLW